MGSITWEGETIRTPVYLSNGEESRYLSEFSEIDFIAMGGFGIVAKCKNNLDNKEYAVKKISLSYANMSFGKLLREVDVLSSMKHPNIVQYYQAWIESKMSGCVFGRADDDDGWEDGLLTEDIESPCLYILMELCSSSLAGFLKKKIPKQIEWHVDIFCQVLRGVGHIHDQGFIHGDLSLSNLFVDRDEVVKIGDFGLARKTEDEGYFCSNSDGNAIYKAPEKSSKNKVDSKIDMFSLGIIFLEILYPFDTGSERLTVIKRVKTSGVPLEWEWDDVLMDVINRLVSKDPTDRPSVAEVLARLENIYAT